LEKVQYWAEEAKQLERYFYFLQIFYIENKKDEMIYFYFYFCALHFILLRYIRSTLLNITLSDGVLSAALGSFKSKHSVIAQMVFLYSPGVVPISSIINVSFFFF
jgi:hypothetical protein